LVVSGARLRDHREQPPQRRILRGPAMAAVLCGPNGLSGGGVGISRIGSRRLDFLGRDIVVRLPGIPRGLCLVFAIFVTSE